MNSGIAHDTLLIHIFHWINTHWLSFSSFRPSRRPLIAHFLSHPHAHLHPQFVSLILLHLGSKGDSLWPQFNLSRSKMSQMSYTENKRTLKLYYEDLNLSLHLPLFTWLSLSSSLSSGRKDTESNAITPLLCAIIFSFLRSAPDHMHIHMHPHKHTHTRRHTSRKDFLHPGRGRTKVRQKGDWQGILKN